MAAQDNAHRPAARTPVRHFRGSQISWRHVRVPADLGSQSDWSRNVRAVGGCSIRLNGIDYVAVHPEVMTCEEARPAVQTVFSPVESAMFRMLAIRQLMLLQGS